MRIVEVLTLPQQSPGTASQNLTPTHFSAGRRTLNKLVTSDRDQVLNKSLSSVPYWRIPTIELLFIAIATIITATTRSFLDGQNEISMFFQIAGFTIAPIYLIQSILLNKIRIGTSRYDCLLSAIGAVGYFTTRNFVEGPSQSGLIFWLLLISLTFSGFFTFIRRMCALKFLLKRVNKQPT